MNFLGTTHPAHLKDAVGRELTGTPHVAVTLRECSYEAGVSPGVVATCPAVCVHACRVCDPAADGPVQPGAAVRDGAPSVRCWLPFRRSRPAPPRRDRAGVAGPAHPL